MGTVQIGRTLIDNNTLETPLIVAEIGVNHECQLKKAYQMIDELAEIGGVAAKFQVYNAKRLATKASPAYWDRSREPTNTQYELFTKYDRLSEADYASLSEHARRRRIEFLATPFDNQSADFLEPLVSAFKIASADITNKPLIEHIAAKDKPILLSTGASEIDEISRAIGWIRNISTCGLAVLHCILNYPTRIVDANLGMIRHLNQAFPDCVIGYSDHTLADYTDDVLPAAWMIGARIIEKHYTWDKTLPGNDHYHSIDKEDLARLIKKLKYLREIIGASTKHSLPSEEPARINARRSLVAQRLIPKGTRIRTEDMIPKRPGTGISPAFVDSVVGCIAATNIEEDEVIIPEKLSGYHAKNGS